MYKSIVNLLELAKDLSQSQNVINEMFGENDFIYFKVDELVDIILDLIGVEDDERGLIRDPYYCLIYDYTLGYSDLNATGVYEKLYEMSRT